MGSRKCMLEWNDFTETVSDFMASLLDDEDSKDVTIVCSNDIQFRAHKLILSYFSPTLRTLIEESQDSCVYPHRVSALEMKAIIEFVYLGETKIEQDNVEHLFEVARYLRIKHLTEEVNHCNNEELDQEADDAGGNIDESDKFDNWNDTESEHLDPLNDETEVKVQSIRITAERLSNPLSKAALKMSRWRAKLSEEEKEVIRKRDRARMRMRRWRGGKDEDAKQAERERCKLAARERRARMTEDQKRLIRERDRQRKAMKAMKMSQEEMQREYEKQEEIIKSETKE